MTLDQYTEFFGLCSIINMGLFAATTAAVMLLKNTVSKIHAKLFNVEESALPKIYFKYIAIYKLLIIVFNIVPYVALKAMS